jgi:uncharacterized protein (DUF1499 family)
MMNPLAWILGLWLPACASIGAAGLPMPPPMDATHIVRPATPNTALAAPPEFTPVPDVFVPAYHVPPRRLYIALLQVAAARHRTYLAADYPDQLQAHWVVRSRLFNFPDLVMAQVVPLGAGSSLVIYSRSVYGQSDLGVNLARIRAWLAALDAALVNPSEK